MFCCIPGRLCIHEVFHIPKVVLVKNPHLHTSWVSPQKYKLAGEPQNVPGALSCHYSFQTRTAWGRCPLLSQRRLSTYLHMGSGQFPSWFVLSSPCWNILLLSRCFFSKMVSLKTMVLHCLMSLLEIIKDEEEDAGISVCLCVCDNECLKWTGPVQW